MEWWTRPLSKQDVDFAGVNLEIELREGVVARRIFLESRRLITNYGCGKLWVMGRGVFVERQGRWSVFEGDCIVGVDGVRVVK